MSARRMDIDNYNKNTDQGLHVTSMSGAYMNVVYGYGGLRTDGQMLSFSPYIPRQWKSYSFKLLYRGSLLHIKVGKKAACFAVLNGTPVTVLIYGKKCRIGRKGLAIRLKK